jgi:two-component SAPR family response regulator
MAKRIIIYGDDHRARELQYGLSLLEAETEVVNGAEKALAELERVQPDALVFVLKVYWEGALDLVKKIKEIKGLEHMQIFYIGDFIESKNQLFLQEKGVKTITMGPVPPEESARYILNQIW